MKNKKKVVAYLKWIPTEEKGRKKPIAVGIRYNPLISFDDQFIGTSYWSADIYVKKQLDNCTSIIELSYLMDNAPSENLFVGSRFSLFEGVNLVAKGVVVEE